jgi:curved DNA-binding protein CbpA
MNEEQNLDFYEILEISPNASQDMIERVFRYLAQRYHPDNNKTGDALKFSRVVKAHDVLREPEKRATYDINHKKNSEYHWNLVEEAADIKGFEEDELVQARVLWAMYVKRKHDMRNSGFGIMELERLTGCPNEILEFHLWYLREKGWIVRLENGLLAITADGIDKVLADHRSIRIDKFITDQHKKD